MMFVQFSLQNSWYFHYYDGKCIHSCESVSLLSAMCFYYTNVSMGSILKIPLCFPLVWWFRDWFYDDLMISACLILILWFYMNGVWFDMEFQHIYYSITYWDCGHVIPICHCTTKWSRLWTCFKLPCLWCHSSDWNLVLNYDRSGCIVRLDHCGSCYMDCFQAPLTLDLFCVFCVCDRVFLLFLFHHLSHCTLVFPHSLNPRPYRPYQCDKKFRSCMCGFTSSIHSQHCSS